MKKLSFQTLHAFVTGDYYRAKATKMLLTALLVCATGFAGFANVIITQGSGGTGICPNTASTGSSPAFTTLGTITVTEGAGNDFSTGSNVILITPPTGWQFSTTVPTFTITVGNNLLAVSGSYSSGSLSINVVTNNATLLDEFTITNLRIQPTSTSATSGYIYATTAFVPGIVTGSTGTNFADLSLSTPVVPSVSIAVSNASMVCAGTNLTFTPTPTNGGAGPSYVWQVNGSNVGAGGTYSSSILNNGDVVTAVMTSNASCPTPATATSNSITASIDPLPTTVSVSGGGSICGATTTITASNGSSGTIYFQGTTSGGTSTSTASTSEVISTSGTYYFRAQSSFGCWGTQGSATVTLNSVPTSVTVSGGTTTCGGTQTITASGGTGGTVYFQGTTSGGTSTATASTSQSISTSGTYYFRSRSSAGCWGTEGSTTVVINPVPAAFSVTGGGAYCSGGSGVAVGLSGSASGVSYQLLLGGIPTGSPVAGTGAAISFGLQTTAGTYTVLATATSGGCTTTMTGSVSVTINSLPTAQSVTGGGNYCSGGSGVAVGLSSSVSGVSYQLYVGASAVGSAVSGTGSSVSFGAQTAGGTYTVVGTTTATGCTNNMTGSASVVVDPLPTAFTVTGGGGYCTGGSGVAVGLSSSTTGVNYQLLVGGVPTGAPVAGTGSAISFGSQTGAGTYTVVATNATTACVSNMTGSATVIINSLPTAFNMSGGGGYCTGGTGVTVGLSGSVSGVNYQLFLGASAVGTPVVGTGSAITFGSQTAAGTYTAVATNSNGCVSNMTGTSTVTINSLPTPSSVTGGGSYCSGGSGRSVGLGGSVSGDTYQLYVGGTPIGSSVSGTGAAISFGSQTGAGTYTVIGTTTATGCTNSMTGSVTISIDPLPGTFTLTGGGTLCAGATGVAVGLGGSASGINYQLLLGGVPTGSPVSGTGSAITFGAQTAAGTYTVLATNATTGCTNTMTGSATVVVNPLPTAYTVTSLGITSYCAGGSGVTVYLSNSDIGINYQLFVGGVAAGAPVAGTGFAINFGAQTAATTYTVVGTNTSTGCVNTMGGSVTLSINPLPTAFSVTGGGVYCSGGTGVAVGLSNSAIGINYQLMVGGLPQGAPVAGTGAAISFGLQTVSGTYTVVATNATTLCTSNMSGSTTVSINPLPNVYSVIGGGGYCIGGTGTTVGLLTSDVGISYQLFRGATLVATLVGTGTTLDFGLQTVVGTYTVVGTNVATGCVSNMTGSATIFTNPLPLAFVVSGGGAYCSGGAGLVINLSGSEVGVNYQLYNGLVPTGLSIAGTGSPISFPAQTASGSYTVIATNATTTCVSNMTGSATIVINPLPVVYNVTGGGSYCAGGTGVHVRLSGSDAGIDYQLYLGGVPTGIILSGTGAALDFGLQTTAGTYTVEATNVATTCINNMSGSVNVSIDPLPNVYTVTSFGATNYCAGGAGIPVFLTNSDLGINYQLYLNGLAVGSAVAGTGGILPFGAQLGAGTYTVVATNTVTTCTENMSGSASVVIDPLPIAFTVTGSGSYCAGGAGLPVNLSGSEIGVDYQLLDGAAVISTVSGTGSAITFGLQTTAATYTVFAMNTATGCSNNMTGSAIISIDPLPVAYTVAGGGTYCAGGAGFSVTLSSSDLGISYQLFNGAIAVGTPLAGTGAMLDFGLQTAGGTYTIVATNTTTSCVNTMTGSATIVVNPLPVAYTVTNGGSYCSGGTGVPVGLSNSDLGISYQLINAFLPVGSPMAGTGSAISFGLQTAAGFYTVQATDNTTLCTSTMTGGVAVTILPLPTAYNVIGGGGYCIGGTGVSVGLSSSDINTNYELWINGIASGMTMAGTGAALDFGLQTTAGVYTIVATNTITTCVSNMTGSVTVVINPLPVAYTISGGGNYCSGGVGLNVYLSNSDIGTNYQLFVGGVPTGSAVAGTGTLLDFGLQTTAGLYSVVATNTVTGCVNNMAGSATVVIDPLPVVYNMTGGGHYCAGATGVNVGLSSSDAGINYQLFIGGTPTGGPVAGTGSALIFGTFTTDGSYTVVATDATTGCSSNMSGAAVVVTDPLPAMFNVTGGGSYCSGGTGVTISLAGSEVGVNYQVLLAGIPDGAPVAGTGSILDLGLHTGAGTYTVVATNATTGCVENMTGSATIIINPLPTAYTVSTGGNFCSGGVGIDVTLSGSDAGIGYQLYNGSTPVGGLLSGTGSSIDFGFQTAGGTYTIVALDLTTFCTSNMTGSSVIVVDPLPVVYTLTGGGSYCAGGSGVNAVLSGSDLGINYQLYLGGVPTGSPVSGSGAALNFVLTTGGVYTIVATDATTGCTSNMVGSATVIVNPLPAAITGTTVICQGSSTTLSDATPLGSWSSSDLSVATINPTTGLLNGVSAGLYSITYTLTSTGCFTAVAGTVNALPVVAAITGAPSVCFGKTTVFSDATPGGVWTSSNTTIASVDAFGLVTGAGAGTATISYAVVSTAGCVTEVNAPITVLAAPVVAPITGTVTNVCAGLTFNLSSATTGGTWTSSNIAVATVDASGVVTGIGFGSAYISYSLTNSAGCTTSATYGVSIGNPMPTSVALPLGSATLCGGNPVNLSVSSAGTGLTYQWAVGGSNISGATDMNYVAGTPGSYTATIGNGTCFITLPSINVILPPNPVILYDTVADVLYTGSFAAYQWYLNATELTGQTKYSTPRTSGGDYTVIVTDGNGCSDTSAVYTYIAPGVNGVRTVVNASDIKIYPNPASSVIYIDAPGKVFITVMSADGKMLMAQKEAVSINVGQLADGVYMIMVYDENNMLLKADKFVKIQ